MSKEQSPRQHNMFTLELDDRRTRRQKRLDHERVKPRQTEMFRQREVALFGVTAHPRIPLSPHTKLVLTSEDPRTEEEIESDRQREAERLTPSMFDASPEVAGLGDEDYPVITLSQANLEGIGLSEAEIAQLDESDIWQIAERLEDELRARGFEEHLTYVVRHVLDEK